MRLLLAIATLSLAGCLVSDDNFGIRTCHTASDCPSVAGYMCASGVKWPQTPCGEGESTCVCEVLFPPTVGGIGLDSGTPVVPDAGPPPDYCTEIKPLIVYQCVQLCHGVQMQYPNAPSDFRLDYWEPGTFYKAPDGGPGLPGIKAKIDRIKVRMYDQYRVLSTRPESMPPPPPHPIQPSEAERELVNKWIVKFGAPLGDGGCEVHDAGTMMGGMDAGQPVVDAGIRFATQILPILTGGGCGCHTGANMAGTMNFGANAAAAHRALVDAGVSAACGVGPRVRVMPGNPQMSQLWLKLRDDPAKCGLSMPRGGVPLAQQGGGAQFMLIEQWIREGARNN